MANDFYLTASQRQHAALEAQKAQELANLQAARASDDEYAAAQAVQSLADIQGAQRNLAALTNEYAASLNPPAQTPVSKEQRAARRWDEMDGQDLLDMARTSKYGRNLTWEDGNMRAGWAEAARRRQRGE